MWRASGAAMVAAQRAGRRMASTKVAKVNEIPSGERKMVKVGEQEVLLVNHENTLYALNPKCPHLGLSLKSIEPRARLMMMDKGQSLRANFTAGGHV
eukprot:765507-Hanusia_phi.AAC.3